MKSRILFAALGSLGAVPVWRLMKEWALLWGAGDIGSPMAGGFAATAWCVFFVVSVVVSLVREIDA